MVMPASARATAVRDVAFADLDRELSVTRRVLERCPEEHYNWKPHEKSMNLGRLAMHVATLPQWMCDTIKRDHFDMSSSPTIRFEPSDRADLLQTFDTQAGAVRRAMAELDDAGLAQTWELRNGDEVLFSEPRSQVLRMWCLNHMIHHRAQLCVYLRLLDVPVPAVYFNSADEPEWVFA
jgi:uncharacterized damage-inducible protein DinB